MPTTSDAYRVEPGQKVRLRKTPTDATGPFKDKADAADLTAKNLDRLRSLQGLLYAQSKHALLVVFQAMDAGGKDGAIRSIFTGVNPQGCQVTSFKVPSTLESQHDFLWRIHAAVPPRGFIGVFNRSHYESVLVERVRGLVPRKTWERRYDQINAFEEMLAAEGVTILKFFLHISKDEQRRRLQDRLNDPRKLWKFSSTDLKEREIWDDYQSAYEDALARCSTSHAPWYIVPSDHKWFRSWVVSDAIVRSLRGLKMSFPPAEQGIEGMKVE